MTNNIDQQSIAVSEIPETIIEAGKSEKNYWKDLYRYRELFLFLSWRDVLVRYKQTVIGIIWAIIRPVLIMIVFTIIFGNIAKLPSNGIPYPILVYAAMLPWQFFSTSLTSGSMSLIGNAGMISKIYFPRLILPASAIIVNLFDFLIAFSILIVLMFYYQYFPTLKIMVLPLFLLLAIIAALGASFWFAALNVKYRDIKYIVPFIVQLGLYISPVGFNSSVIPEKWRLLYSINPMVSVIDGFRWALLGKDFDLYLPGFILSALLVLIVFLSGLWYFRKTERTFADVI
jgi:lipopolysaccharide transport system permease protein